MMVNNAISHSLSQQVSITQLKQPASPLPTGTTLVNSNTAASFTGLLSTPSRTQQSYLLRGLALWQCAVYLLSVPVQCVWKL